MVAVNVKVVPTCCGEFGLPDTGAFAVEELMRGTQFRWYGKLQNWRFVPHELPFAIFRIRPWQSGG